jgi:hypothetical protein
MADEAQEPSQCEDEPPVLDYMRPRLIRRHQRGALWKSIVRVIGGMLVTMSLAGLIVSTFTMPFDALVAIIGLAGVATLIWLVMWERGMVLKEPLWEGAKDLRATTWRSSASRFDSSGVTIVDPNPPESGSDDSPSKAS